MHWLLRPGSGTRGDGPDHRGGQQGAAGHPRGAQLRRAHRPGAAGRRALRHRLHRELDQCRPERRLRRDGRQRSRRSSTGTPGCSATCRPTSRSGSKRCSPAPATPSSCASTGRSSPSCAPRPTRSRAAMAAVEGTVDVKAERLVDIPQIQVTVDLTAAQRYGLKPGDVRRATATVLSGEEVGDIFRAGRAYDVQVWSTPATRENLDDIRAMPIDTPSGDGCGWTRSRSWRSSRPPTTSTTRTPTGRSTSPPTSRAATSAPWPATIEDRRAIPSRSRRSTTRRSLVSTPSGRPRRRGCTGWPSSPPW